MAPNLDETTARVFETFPVLHEAVRRGVSVRVVAQDWGPRLYVHGFSFESPLQLSRVLKAAFEAGEKV
ncbi:hypothetical protein QFZ43_003277 [Streptomyces afghaniensis]|nr:hypothetical protein [Streptomyces afghaniensis]